MPIRALMCTRYLVVTESSDVVLIDTGVGEGNAYVDTTFEPARTSIVDELARFGVATSDVGFVVNSHLHFDHCGNNRLFPKASVFIQKAELEAARDVKARYTVNRWFDYRGARITEVDGDLEITSGVQLLASPGHTPGHQSVLITNSSERILVAAQAAFTVDEYHRGGDPKEQAHEGLEDRYLRVDRSVESPGSTYRLLQSRCIVTRLGRRENLVSQISFSPRCPVFWSVVFDIRRSGSATSGSARRALPNPFPPRLSSFVRPA